MKFEKAENRVRKKVAGLLSWFMVGLILCFFWWIMEQILQLGPFDDARYEVLEKYLGIGFAVFFVNMVLGISMQFSYNAQELVAANVGLVYFYKEQWGRKRSREQVHILHYKIIRKVHWCMPTPFHYWVYASVEQLKVKPDLELCLKADTDEAITQLYNSKEWQEKRTLILIKRQFHDEGAVYDTICNLQK